LTPEEVERREKEYRKHNRRHRDPAVAVVRPLVTLKGIKNWRKRTGRPPPVIPEKCKKKIRKLKIVMF
jgi:hypothetical protein